MDYKMFSLALQELSPKQSPFPGFSVLQSVLHVEVNVSSCNGTVMFREEDENCLSDFLILQEVKVLYNTTITKIHCI